ncbi:MAG: Hsp70 family protein [Pseudomonadota bacterium]
MPKWVLADDVGIETVGGVFTVVLEKGTEIPCEASQVFTTAEDGQSEVVITLVQGRHEAVSSNRRLGIIKLGGIAYASAGLPQIEVGFSIDVDGTLSANASDRATQNRQSVRVAATEEARVKLHDADADPELAEPLSLVGPDGAVTEWVARGEFLPAFKRLRITTTEPDQSQITVKFVAGTGRTLAEKTFRLNGNEGPAGRSLDLSLDVAVATNGALELWRRSKDGELGACIFTSDAKLAITAPKGAAKGAGQAASPFDDVFAGIFGPPGTPKSVNLPPKYRSAAGDGGKPDAEPAAETDAAASGPSGAAGAGAGDAGQARAADETPGRVFISHASGDAGLAGEVVASLEEGAGYACWIAPRNVRAGHDYRTEILTNIKRCSHFILLMSETANQSPHVLREVSLADQYSKRIILIKLSDVSLRPELEYLLHGRHWVRWEDTREAIDRLL